MGVQVAHHEDDLFSGWAHLVEKPLSHVRPVILRATFQGLGVPPSSQRLGEHEDVRVPFRLYSQSTRSSFPGSTGSGSREWLSNWYGFLSMHTTGVFS